MRGGRYSDPGLEPTRRAGEIDPQALLGLRQLMLARIEDNDDLNDYLAAFMSRFRLAHDPVPPPDLTNPESLLKALQNGSRLFRNPWTRLTWIENLKGARLFAAGHPYDCSIWLAESLCEWEQPRISADMLDRASLDTLTRLINNGHFLLTI